MSLNVIYSFAKTYEDSEGQDLSALMWRADQSSMGKSFHDYS